MEDVRRYRRPRAVTIGRSIPGHRTRRRSVRGGVLSWLPSADGTRVAFLLSLVFHVLLAVIALFVRLKDAYRSIDEDVLVVDVRQVRELPPKRIVRAPRPVEPVTLDASLLDAERRPDPVEALTPPFRSVSSARAALIENPVSPADLRIASFDGTVVDAGSRADLAVGIGAETNGGSRKMRIATHRGPSVTPSTIRKTLAAEASAKMTAVPPPMIQSPLEAIADHLAEGSRTTPRVDVVFLLDISQSMTDNIYAVGTHLGKMAERLSQRGLDYRIGIVTFHDSTWNKLFTSSVEVMPLTLDVDKVRRKLRKIKCSGGEKALNAIMEAIERVEFREGSIRQFILVTDEYVDGDFEVREVLGALYRARIRVDVIGMDEPFQRALPARTGGVWIPIASLNS